MHFTPQQAFNILGPAALVLAGIIFLIIRSMSGGKSKSPAALIDRRGKKRLKAWKNSAYSFLSGLPMISIYMENIKARLYAAHGLDELALREYAVNQIFKSAVIALVVFVGAFILFDKTIYNMALLIIISAIVFNSFLNNFIGNDDILLEQLPEAITDLKHYFASEKTIEKAFSEAIKSIPYEVGLHFQRILEIIKLPYAQGKIELRRYYEECPDRYLKILASYCFITSEYGDIQTGSSEIGGGDSLFNKNMNHLISEIRNEFRKRRNVKMHLFGQKFFVMAPIFALPLFKRYLLAFINLPSLEEFYTSSIGYIDMIACTGISIFCYAVYNGIMKSNRSEQKLKLTTRSWEDVLLKNSVVKLIVFRLMPSKSSKRYRRLVAKINESGSLQKLEWFYLKKTIVFTVTFLLLFSVTQVVHIIGINKIYDDIAYGVKDKIVYENMLEMNTGMSKEKLQQIDRDILGKLNKFDRYNTIDEKDLKAYITTLLQKENIQLAQSVEMNVDRIYNKFKAIKSAGATIFEMLFVLIVSWLSYFVLNMRLEFYVRIQRLSAMDEIVSYQTVILLLIFHRKATPEMVLEWLVWFSDIFYKPLSEAKNNYNDKKLGGVNALKKLQEEVNYKPLRQIIQNLILAEEKLPLVEAFGELEQDQKFSSEIRKDNTEVIIQTKVALASRIASFSSGFTLIFYLVAPIVYSIVMMLSDILKTITLS